MTDDFDEFDYEDFWYYHCVFSSGGYQHPDELNLRHQLVVSITKNPWPYDNSSQEQKMISKMRNHCSRCGSDLTETGKLHHAKCELGFLKLMGLFWALNEEQMQDLQADPDYLKKFVQQTFRQNYSK